MSNFDPNRNQARDRNIARDPMTARPAPSGWTLGIGLAVVVAIVGFLAFGHTHNGSTTASTPPGAPTAMNPQPLSPPATATLPAARNPSETTGSGSTAK